MCKDLTKDSDILSISDLLKKQKPSLLWLVNNAGIARMAPSTEFSIAEIKQTIDLNCKAPTELINICIPFMEKGSKILNVSSASAFQPVPYINLYAAAKAFKRSYSRALNVELKPYKITVTAVCPSWVDTKMLSKNMNGKNVHFPGIVVPEKVVKKALKAAKKRQGYVCLLFLCKMSAFKRKVTAAKINNEDLVTWYQKIFIKINNEANYKCNIDS